MEHARKEIDLDFNQGHEAAVSYRDAQRDMVT